MVDPVPFTPPPYPYDRLDELHALADKHTGGCVDLSVGTPTDPPPPRALDVLDDSVSARGYPKAVGSEQFRAAAARWLQRRFGVSLDPADIAACVGTKELVAGLPSLLRLREPSRDTVLYPAPSYPTYAMGATLAGCRPVPVPADDQWRMNLDAIDPADADRALCVWVNTPGNPAGNLDDLDAVAEWGRAHGVPVLSDECYAEFTWDGSPRTVLTSGQEGVLAVHSLSKRSNLAGLRVGFYAGDPPLVRFLAEVRRHAGLMVPGPVQTAAVIALDDDEHVVEQRARYQERLRRGREILDGLDLEVPLPGGGFYLWAPSPDGDGWSLARRLAEEGGALVSPGEFYGEAGEGHVRIAMVRPVEQLDRVAQRLGLPSAADG